MIRLIILAIVLSMLTDPRPWARRLPNWTIGASPEAARPRRSADPADHDTTRPSETPAVARGTHARSRRNPERALSGSPSHGPAQRRAPNGSTLPAATAATAEPQSPRSHTPRRPASDAATRSTSRPGRSIPRCRTAPRHERNGHESRTRSPRRTVIEVHDRPDINPRRPHARSVTPSSARRIAVPIDHGSVPTLYTRVETALRRPGDPAGPGQTSQKRPASSRRRVGPSSAQSSRRKGPAIGGDRHAREASAAAPAASTPPPQSSNPERR